MSLIQRFHRELRIIVSRFYGKSSPSKVRTPVNERCHSDSLSKHQLVSNETSVNKDVLYKFKNMDVKESKIAIDYDESTSENCFVVKIIILGDSAVGKSK